MLGFQARPVLMLIVLAGCDQLFQLGQVVPDPDTNPDAFVPAASCPLEYSVELVEGGSRYRVVTTARSGVAHHADCTDDTAGLTHLAVLQDRAEADALSAMLDASGDYAWFMGAVQAPSTATPTDDWLWLSGEAVSPSMWAAGEPNDFGAPEDNQENFSNLQTQRLGLVDAFEGSQFQAVCECDGRGIDPRAGSFIGGP